LAPCFFAVSITFFGVLIFIYLVGFCCPSKESAPEGADSKCSMFP
jgi:hypothetical protein